MALPCHKRLRFSSGLRPQALELEIAKGAEPKSIIARLWQGTAVPHNSWQSRIKATWTFKAKPYRPRSAFVYPLISWNANSICL